jgi:hypothetical protein
MYELHAAVSAITVEGKTFADICTRVPIADIFHSTRPSPTRRRDRRSAIRTETEELTPPPTAPPPYVNASVVSEEDPLSSPTEIPSPTVPKDTKKTSDDVYDTLWADYDYDYDRKVAAETAAARIRIDFDKFGRRTAKYAAIKDGSDLPKDIYCDLVNSLQDMCLQTSLLEIWRYDKVDMVYYRRESKKCSIRHV